MLTIGLHAGDSWVSVCHLLAFSEEDGLRADTQRCPRSVLVSQRAVTWHASCEDCRRGGMMSCNTSGGGPSCTVVLP